MNLDFVLFNPPAAKTKFVDLWGEVIFIPKFKKVTHKREKSSFLLSSLFSCSNPPPSSQQTSIETSEYSQTSQSSQSTKDSSPEFQYQQIDHYIPCLFLDSLVQSKYIMIYFHASGEDIKQSKQFLDCLRKRLRINVIAMEYPGYSLYQGQTQIARINQDAHTVYDFVTKTIGFHQNNTIICGRSIGTGVALQLAKRVRTSCLALISPFAGVKGLFKDFVGLLGNFVKESYDNIENIMLVKCPVFILHGQKDKFIPLYHSKQLIKNCYTRKHLQTPLNMTHSEFDYCEDFVEPLNEFLLVSGINFFESDMKGPSMQEQFFQLPEYF